MRHDRADYNRIQDPAVKDPKLAQGGTPIAEDEPVFILRAKDVLAPHNVLDYAARAEESGLPDVAEGARRVFRAMREWQEVHGNKMPDLPKKGQPSSATVQQQEQQKGS